MTNTNTADTASTVKQIIDLYDAGCEMVRVATRNKSEAENLHEIKSQLKQLNCLVPIIADVHYQPETALIAARYAEKVRINPGNYVDKPESFSKYRKKITYDTATELEKIRQRLLPLIEVCKQHGTAIRVGVNHGSLSERITMQYGNTPEGMVISALEFINLFAYEGFHNLVLSIKSSDVKTMIYAYRLLAARMIENGYFYPLHLGVTEAGAGLNARIKSAAGIGLLLQEGIGDTVRVSLTENPVNEMPVAREICQNTLIKKNPLQFSEIFEYSRKPSKPLSKIGGQQPPVVILCTEKPLDLVFPVPDYIFNHKQNLLLPTGDAMSVKVYQTSEKNNNTNSAINEQAAIFFDFTHFSDLHQARQKLSDLHNQNPNQPVILYKKYTESYERLIFKASSEFSFFLSNGLVDGIAIDAACEPTLLTELMFSVLQAVGLRRNKAEFIACPTCGRTSYNVEQTLNIVTEKLAHLKHLKIAVMGCIVNGPGEMADADYGYVGSGLKKVNLYKNKIAVRKNIDEDVALDELIALIKENNDWTEPE